MNAIKCSFKDLFGCVHEINESKIIISDIVIPRIQRDYAQGRMKDDVKRIRDRFLEALSQAITQNNEIVLDFIYGDIKIIPGGDIDYKKGLLTLLDGQQRLTTLFLLHWYIAKKEKINADECEFLSHFTYDTRFSSRDFCEKLIMFTPDFEKKISASIIDQPWYPLEWKNDPTIQSMLVMLDAIHIEFKEKENLWESLVVNKNVSFYFLPVINMGDPEELYIKMNSRGKPLTLFEQVKAEFEKNLKQIFSEDFTNDVFKKFDIQWTDMLFPYQGDNCIIDDAFMRYFQFISDILWYQTKDNKDTEKDAFKLLDALYGKDCKNAKENINYFIDSFDIWCMPNTKNIEAFFNKYFYNTSYENNKVRLYQNNINILKECFDESRFPLTRYLLLYSVNTYLQNMNTVSEKDFIKRIRIIRNLIENSEYEIRKEQMKTLLSETQTIILSGIIPESDKGSPGYNDFQKNEEREKIKWLEINPDKKEELYQLEDHELLRGSVSIIGLENSHNFKKFKLLFDKCGKTQVDRAMLSLGDCTQGRQKRFFTGLKNNWVDLFHHSNQRDRFGQTKEILGVLLNSFNENDSITEKLTAITENYLNDKNTIKDWRYYFVKYHESLNKEDKVNYIEGDGNYIKDNEGYGYDTIKLRRYQLNGYNWNVFLYLLYKEDPKNKKMGKYYYNYNNKLEYKDFLIDCLSDRFIVYKGEKIINEFPVQQENGIDTEDRIEKGKMIIKNL